MVNTKNSLNKIVFLDAGTLNSNICLDRLNDFGDIQIYKRTKESELLARVREATVIITNKVVLSEDVLKQAKKLKLICIAATGMNNVNLEAAQMLDIQVKNVVGYSTNSVVQHTFAFATCLLGNLLPYLDYTKKGEWCKSDFFTYQKWDINEIANKTWGIIGLGQIGKKVATIANCFGAKVHYYSTSGKNINQEFTQVSLQQLLENSDIISIHAPLNDKTLNLINKNNLIYLKENVVLINVGRGGIINEDDLFDYATKNKLSIGLDVLSEEPMVLNSSAHNLSKLPNVIITPHAAWSSLEAQTTLLNEIYKNISEFIS